MTAQILEKCSLYKPYLHRQHGWCMSKRPETVSIIDMLFSLKQVDLLNTIRKTTDISERKSLKKQLWAITPSSIAEGGRGADYVKERNGLIQFDIDKFDNKSITPEKLLELFEIIKEIPYTVYCGKSASGNGLWGLFRVSSPDKHSQHYNAMEKLFKTFGIQLDPAPKNIASLRFLAYDPNAYVNHNAVLFEDIIEQVTTKAHVPNTYTSQSGEASNDDAKAMIQKFNHNCSAQDIYQILENFGFQYHSTSGNKLRFTRPGKETKAGLSLDYHTDRRTLYSFSSEVPLLEYWKSESGGWSCSPITALLLYGFGGMEKKHWAMALNYLKLKSIAI